MYKKHNLIIGNITNSDWDEILIKEYSKPYFKELIKTILIEYQNHKIYPKFEDIFNAFKMTNFNNVKVLILGQDPYHGFNQAHGLSFSVFDGVKRPPSLNNIFKELKNDLGIERLNNNLSDWACQGVLLLNSILTVRENEPLSHQKIGWEEFTDNIIKILNNKKEPVVFILWGNYAKTKKKMITSSHHLIIEGAHPSPLSANRGFLGSKPFSKTNKFLEKNNISKIDW